MNQPSPIALMSALAAALCACATTPPTPPVATPGPTLADRHRILVAETAERYDLLVSPGAPSLSAQDLSGLARFAQAYVRIGQGPLMISTPVGTADPTPVRLAAQEARLALAEAGVSPAALALSTYDGGGSASAPIVLSFTRYEAIAPDCRPLWEQNLAQNRHQAHESFGCATAANLAAMIEQPGDLLAPREESPRDAARRAAVLEAYRQGQPTHAVRSADERVAVSTAVQ